VSDPHDLRRFVVAQQDVYDAAVSELRAGHKTSHWMWFIFPQIAGLGRSQAAVRYALSGPEEARAYLEHPILGARLREATEILTELNGLSAVDIFGGLDAQKLRSSMTLFARSAPDEPLFQEVLDQYFKGELDRATLDKGV
jgi:uncharacterized protein (DUF1810 family)